MVNSYNGVMLWAIYQHHVFKAHRTVSPWVFLQDRHPGKDYLEEGVCALTILRDTAKLFFKIPCFTILSLVSFFTVSS